MYHILKWQKLIHFFVVLLILEIGPQEGQSRNLDPIAYSFQGQHNYSSLPIQLLSSPQSSLNMSSVSETFSQLYCGTELDIFDDEQITAFEVVLKLNTRDYGPDGGEPNVQTKVIFELQKFYNDGEVLDSSLDCSPSSRISNEEHKKLIIIFTVTWSSSVMILNKKEYVESFIHYMSSNSTKAQTIALISSVGKHVLDVSDVIVQEYDNLQEFFASFTSTIEPSNRHPLEQFSSEIVPSREEEKSIKISILITCVVLLTFFLVPFLGIILSFKWRSQTTSEKKRVKLTREIVLPSSSIFRLATDTKSNNLPFFESFDSKELTSNNEKTNNITANSRSKSFCFSSDASRSNFNHSEASSQTDLFPVKPISGELFLELTTAPSLSNCSSSASDYAIDLEDELDKYKDPNLELLRFLIESKVSYCEDMISHSITQALLLEGDEIVQELEKINFSVNDNELVVEAKMLWKTYDWLKRKGDRSFQERSEFLQKILNEVIFCAIYEMVNPIGASRILHECCTLLLWKQEEDIPETTIIVLGMRKKVKTINLWKVFRNFGDIEHIAIAPKRGFGFVRYLAPSSAYKVLDTLKEREIVVQDVAVNVKQLFTVDSFHGNEDGTFFAHSV